MHSRIGETYKTKNYGICTIVEYANSQNCTVKFEDGTIVKNLYYWNIVQGRVKNPYHKNIYGVGYTGEGKYYKKGGGVYKHWYSMFVRCYSDKYIGKLIYANVTVCEEWHNFQNFAKWFEHNYSPKIMEKWELDKDILIRNNKVYSPEACCFIPKEINRLWTKRHNERGILPIGVTVRKGRYRARVSKENKRVCLGSFDTPEEAFQAYKIEKEKYIKEVADKWKGKIDDRVYEALYNYKIEITD